MTPQLTISSRHKPPKEPIIIGICGGKSSGKSELVDFLQKSLNLSSVVVCEQAFYKNPWKHFRDSPEVVPSDLDSRRRTLLLNHNFYTPSAIDWEAFTDCLQTLKERKSVKRRQFNFEMLKMDEKEVRYMPAEVIIVMGTMILYQDNIRKMLGRKIFLEADDDVRLSKSVFTNIDPIEKGTYSIDEFIDTYYKFMKPGFEQFIEPTKKYADFIVPNYGFCVDGPDLGKSEIQYSGMSLILKHIEYELKAQV